MIHYRNKKSYIILCLEVWVTDEESKKTGRKDDVTEKFVIENSIFLKICVN